MSGNQTSSDIAGDLAAQQERRMLPLFFEVHHWPHQGRILVINKEPHQSKPILTWLEVTTSMFSRADATTVIAAALAAASAYDVPGACVVLHDRHGSMLSTPAGLGLPVTALRRAL